MKMSYIKKAWQKNTAEETDKIKEHYKKYDKNETNQRNIIITEYQRESTFEINENGERTETTKFVPVKTNLTKKINETAKKLKIDNNLAILDKIGAIMEDNNE